MKKIVYLSVLVGGLFLMKPATADAQISINISIGSNLGHYQQPAWGPWGYNDARYYYMPQYDLYYDLVRSEYIWYDGYRWAMVNRLPAHLRNINLYNTYKVVLNQNKPWDMHHQIRAKYRTYANNYKQVNIRDGRARAEEVKRYASVYNPTPRQASTSERVVSSRSTGSSSSSNRSSRR